MNRWSNYSARDTQETRDGDLGFVGVDMTRDRDQLGPGMMTRSQNKRCLNRKCQTRPGTAYPQDFNPAFGNALIGSAVYNNPNAEEVMLVAELNAPYIWVLEYGKDPYKVSLSAGATTGLLHVEFIQSFDKVLLLRWGAGMVPLIWDGVRTAGIPAPNPDPAHTFDPLPAVPNPPSNAFPIPMTSEGQPYMDRVLLYDVFAPSVPWRDQIIVTNTGDVTTYDDVWGVFRINSGESDWISTVFPYFKGGVIVGKRRSTHLLANFTLDPTLAEQRVLSSRIGMLSNKCLVEDGADVIFLSEPGGFYALTEVIVNQIAAEPVPVSEQIQPIIDRINWAVAQYWACGQVLGRYAFFAVPIDGVLGGCNAILVLNTVTRQWESVPDLWLDPNFRINALHCLDYDGVRRLYAVDYVNKAIYLLYEGVSDQLTTGLYPVSDLMETRGYTSQDPGSFKRFRRAIIGLSTFNPTINVTAITDGYNEEQLLTEDGPLTKDRLNFYTHGHPDFDPVAGDPDEPMREDYSVVNLEDYAGQDFEGLQVGPIYSVPGTVPTMATPKQQTLERFPILVNGRWLSLRIENTDGACDVLGVGVDAIPISETERMLA